MSKSRTVYCHFSFKRPKEKPGVGYFAVVFFNEKQAINKIAQRTVERKLWKDQQFITAIQAYEYALSFIYEWQGVMMDKGIGQVMLVTDNGILAGWIENPNKNKEYSDWMNKANAKYQHGAPKEIVVGVGLCNVQKSERAYYYCNEKKVARGYHLSDVKDDARVKVDTAVSVYDLMDADEEEPVVTWGNKQG